MSISHLADRLTRALHSQSWRTSFSVFLYSFPAFQLQRWPKCHCFPSETLKREQTPDSHGKHICHGNKFILCGIWCVNRDTLETYKRAKLSYDQPQTTVAPPQWSEFHWKVLRSQRKNKLNCGTSHRIKVFSPRQHNCHWIWVGDSLFW